MTYQLFVNEGSSDDARGRWLGDHPDFDTALLAAQADVLARLRAADGGWVTVRHDVIGPGALGADTVHPVVTRLGPRPGDPDLEATLVAAREWLSAARAAAGSG